MARYEVQHNYRSNDYGPYYKGAHVELQSDEAAWVNKDSPGTLVEIDPEIQAREKRDRRKAETAKRAAAKKAEAGHGGA